MTAARREPAPLSAEEYAALMAALGPFEQAPRLAVAVSGGADSMALTLLADAWARARGGGIDALTVDHGLRPGSDREAEGVGRRLAARGIRHHLLRWEGPKPAGNVQATARAARYRLLDRWCAAAGVLHLLVAHHADDQAETLLLRLGRGSGSFGLAGMAPVVELHAARLLRPLLRVSRERLRATAAAMGSGWVEDPSNASATFARSRLRRRRATLEEAGLTHERLGGTARRLAAARVALERELVLLLARSVSLRPEGYARVDGGRLGAAAAEIRLRGLGAVIACIGAAERPPRMARIERLAGCLERVRTLGGCRIEPDGAALLVCRDPGEAVEEIAVSGGRPVLWDGRFLLSPRDLWPQGAVLRRLGPVGRRRLERLGLGDAAARIPPPARAALPALWEGERLVAVPHLGWGRPVASAFRPPRPLFGAPFALV